MLADNTTLNSQLSKKVSISKKVAGVNKACCTRDRHAACSSIETRYDVVP